MLVKVCLLVVLATVVMSAPADNAPSEEAPKELTIEEHWANFKKDHEKNYKSPEEEQRRFQIFKDNKKGIDEHNKKYEAGETTYTQGINAFADLTQEEFAETHLMKVPLPPNNDENLDTQ